MIQLLEATRFHWDLLVLVLGQEDMSWLRYLLSYYELSWGVDLLWKLDIQLIHLVRYCMNLYERVKMALILNHYFLVFLDENEPEFDILEVEVFCRVVKQFGVTCYLHL